jgi:DNA-binding winged helix-turn-helix (wHTH) protein
MSSSPVEAYEFGPFRLEPAERRLLRDGEDVPLPPKALDLLIALVSRPGRLVTRETLLEEIWPGTFVEEANLSYTVSLLRKAIDDGNGDGRYIDTVPKRGYRFKGEVRRLTADCPDVPATLIGDVPLVALPAALPAAEPRPWEASGWMYSAVGFVVLGLAAVSLMAALQQPAGDTPVFSSPARFEVAVPGNLWMGPFGGPSLSPDGRWLVWGALLNGTGQLWTRRLDSGVIQPLPGTEHGGSAFWSPDSHFIGFFADGKLKRVAVDGGPVLTLCDAAARAEPGAWGANGVILFSMGGIYRVPATGGVPQPVTELDTSQAETEHVLAGFLSDGRRFLFRDRRRTGSFFVSSIDSPRLESRSRSAFRRIASSSFPPRPGI